MLIAEVLTALNQQVRWVVGKCLGRWYLIVLGMGKAWGWERGSIVEIV